METKKHLKLIMFPVREQEEDTVKIATSLSVPQLALLFRLMVEDNIIRVPDVSHLTKFIATNFTSLRNESISMGSVRNKYYDVDKATTRTMTGLLNRMISKAKNQTKK